MATDAQRLAFKLADRQLAANAEIMADFDAIWAVYAEQVNYDLLPPQDHDLVVALLIANQLRLGLPDAINAAGALTGTTTTAENTVSSRSFATLDLPAGYDPDWYKNSPGHRLIAMHQRAGAGLPLFL